MMHDEDYDGWTMVERPERAYRGSAPRLYVSLNKRGEISLNAAAWSAIGEPYSVTLMYHAPTRRIAVKSPVPADRNFFPVKRHGRGRRNRIVRAARLLRQFGIEIHATVVFHDVVVRHFRGSPLLELRL